MLAVLEREKKKKNLNHYVWHNSEKQHKQDDIDWLLKSKNKSDTEPKLI